MKPLQGPAEVISEHLIKQSFRIPVEVDLLLYSLRIDLRCDRR